MNVAGPQSIPNQSLYRIVLLPFLIFVGVIFVINVVIFYSEHTGQLDQLFSEMRHSIVSQKRFFENELYLKTVRASKARVALLVDSFAKNHPTASLCVSWSVERLGEKIVKCHNPVKRYARKAQIALHLGSEPWGQIEYQVAVPLTLAMIFPKKFVFSVALALLFALLIVRFLIGRLQRKLVQPLLRSLREQGRRQGVEETAIQLAHDIRSPLSALLCASDAISQLPENNRVLLREAVSRINDISNQLLGETQSNNTQGSTYLLHSVIDSLATEKRAQFSDRVEVGFDILRSTQSYSLFLDADLSDFKRVLSNLLNNAFEAIDGSGNIEVRLSEQEAFAIIEIADTGRGIEDTHLSHVFEKGFSFGKQGSGLGLYHAKKTIESWKGRLEINSTVNVGTSVKLFVPKAIPPDWFVPELNLEKKQWIVIVDDDPSIERIWKNKLESLQINRRIHSIRNPSRLAPWIEESNIDVTQCLFLVDYEFIGFQERGTQIIAASNIAKHSYLVTSRFAESTIQKEVSQLGIGLIPKNMAQYIPIVETKTPAPIAIIDDDRMVHLSWQTAAENAGSHVDTFSCLEEFLASDPAKNTVIYLDYELGSAVTGAEVAKTLRELGYSQVYLMTGYRKQDLPQDLPILAIVDKTPIWTTLSP